MQQMYEHAWQRSWSIYLRPLHNEIGSKWKLKILFHAKRISCSLIFNLPTTTLTTPQNIFKSLIPTHHFYWIHNSCHSLLCWLVKKQLFIHFWVRTEQLNNWDKVGQAADRPCQFCGKQTFHVTFVINISTTNSLTSKNIVHFSTTILLY